MPAGPLDPDRLAATEFSTSFRGYDADEVRALLMAVSDELRASSVREHDLREQLARAEQALREARDASEAAAAEAEQAVAAAAEEGRQQGREMVAEAQRVRERMLGDLARRRRQARQQVEQLMAGRERLLTAFDTARQTIEVATQEMRTSLPEARHAAEAAGRRFEHDDVDEIDETEAVAALEGEIQAARLAGLPIVEPEASTQGTDEGPAADSGEPSLLGERDVREMPPVELSAEFEDVRIVPIDDDGHDEEPVVEAADTTETAAAAEDGAHGEVADATEPDDLAGADEPDHEGEPAAEVEHLDDLFASLRAARADAVDDARAVLARDESSVAPDDAATSAEPEPEPGSASGASPEPVAPPEPVDAPTGGPLLDPVDIDGALVAATDALASALKRVLADEQNDLLERLRGLRKNQTAAEAEVLEDGTSLTDRFAGVAVAPLTEVALVARASTNPSPRARPPAVAPLADEVAVGLVGPLRERLARGLADAGTDGSEAAARARATFREWKTQRIAAVAADAARSAYHLGLLAGVPRSQRLEWVVDDDEGACVECADNALAGAVRPGDRYPTGHRHPPAHDGCRCLLRLPQEETP